VILQHMLKRILIVIPMIFVISIMIFIIIQLPPGDYLTTHIMNLKSAGYEISEEQIARLVSLYDLDRPMHEQYISWIKNILLKGNLGRSFQENRPVSELIAERLPFTVIITLSTLIFIWIISVPVGIYSATHQYTFFDYFWTFVGFIGISVPGFLLALILMYFSFSYFGITGIGLLSPEFQETSWTFAKWIDLFKHLWLPVVLIGSAGTAGLIRVLRGNLLDELKKQYVVTARSKGLSEKKLLFKYPVRVAIIPIISTIGWMLPGIVSGETLVSTVLNLPTMGPLMLKALLNQDMYLAGGVLLILCVLTIIGTFISDVLLVCVDPRIKFQEVSK